MKRKSQDDSGLILEGNEGNPYHRYCSNYNGVENIIDFMDANIDFVQSSASCCSMRQINTIDWEE